MYTRVGNGQQGQRTVPQELQRIASPRGVAGLKCQIESRIDGCFWVIGWMYMG